MKPITPDDQPLIVPTKDAGWLWGRTKYKVKVQWSWIWRGILILAQPEYIFDAASIPRPAWSLLGYTPDGLHRAASLAHDIGCDREGILITGASIGRPEFQSVLLGDATVPNTPANYAGQLSSAEVHELWGDFLRATEGTRKTKNNLMARTVAWFGPRW